MLKISEHYCDYSGHLTEPIIAVKSFRLRADHLSINKIL